MIEKVSKLGLALLGMLCIPVAVQGQYVVSARWTDFRCGK